MDALSDLAAGFAATLLIGSLGLLLRISAVLAAINQASHALGGPEQLDRWVVDRVLPLRWPILALVFFGTSLGSAIYRGTTGTAIIAFGVILVVPVLILLLRFGPERLHLSAPTAIQPVVRFVRAYPWRILTGIFFLSSLGLLGLNIQGSSESVSSERIVFVVGLDDTEMLVMREILDELEPQLGAEVFLMNVDPSRQVARLDSMVASGDMKWDLVAVDNNMLGLLAAKGLVEELSEFTERDDVIPEPLLPSVRPLLNFEDRFYFAPFRTNVRIGYYNESKFDDDNYDLDPPRTWTELLDVAKAFKEKGGVGRVAISGFPGPPTAVTVYEFVRAWGGNPRTLDDAGSREAFAFLQQLDAYLAPQYVDTKFDTANDLLMDDQVYLVSNWTFGIQVVIIDGQKEEVKAYSGWKGPIAEVHVLGGDLLAVPKGAPHPDKAIELIKLLQTSETQRAFLSELFWLPVRLDALTGIPVELEPHFPAINEALALSEARPTIPQWPLAEDCLNGAFQALIVDGGDLGALEEWSSILKEISSIQYVSHRVEEGDTFETLASRYHTTPNVLAEVNRTTTRASLATGQVLLVLPELERTCYDVPSSS